MHVEREETLSTALNTKYRESTSIVQVFLSIEKEVSYCPRHRETEKLIKAGLIENHSTRIKKGNVITYQQICASKQKPHGTKGKDTKHHCWWAYSAYI